MAAARICECLLGFRGVRSAGRCDATSLPTAVYWNLRGFDNFCSTSPGRGWAPPWAPRNRTLDKYATGPPDTRRLSIDRASHARHCKFQWKLKCSLELCLVAKLCAQLRTAEYSVPQGFIELHWNNHQRRSPSRTLKRRGVFILHFCAVRIGKWYHSGASQPSPPSVLDGRRRQEEAQGRDACAYFFNIYGETPALDRWDYGKTTAVRYEELRPAGIVYRKTPLALHASCMKKTDDNDND